MDNLEDIRAQLELDISWRRTEMRRLNNVLMSIIDTDVQVSQRRCLFMMLYAHYEGFFKLALSTYAQQINNLNIKCGDVKEALAAASFSRVFSDLADVHKIPHLLKGNMLMDENIKIVARRAAFINQMRQFDLLTVNIEEKSVVKTDSNLWLYVLRPILFQLGFDSKVFDIHEGDIKFLMNTRNTVAHGGDEKPLKQENYENVQRVVFEMMSDMAVLITNALIDESYLRTQPTII